MNNLHSVLQDKINAKTKPPGALGALEDIALQAGLIQQSENPVISNPHILVFAGDHGIAATGLVNPYPQSVTAQMVLNFLNGGAAINVFCKQNNISLKIIDAGVNYAFTGYDKLNNFVHAKIGYGTKNYLEEDAMTETETMQAIEQGKTIVTKIVEEDCNCIGLGEMGIGNTSSAALLMSAITAIPVEECTGRGTGTSDEQLHRKIVTLENIFAKHELQNVKDPIHLLKKIGGFEIAMMTGAYLQAAKENMIIVVDGFIATAALLVAQCIDKNILNNCIFAHTSGEQGHEKMLAYLKAKPLLNLGMRLGEGTGAALAMPLIQSAVNFLNEMASFESAGVSGKN